jgi:[NiFe] hydrogenase diaphorase moiety large subunit
MDIARDVQDRFGCVAPAAMDLISRITGAPRVEVESLVSFYSFLSRSPKGQVVIRLCDDIIDRMHGYHRVARAFSEELGIGLGETTADGKISLERTACIGLSDQAPAALVNEVPVTELSTDRAREIVAGLREHMDPRRLVTRSGDGQNAHPLVRAMVRNNLRQVGPLVFSEQVRGKAISNALAMSPAEVIRAVKNARLRGRGGAGFPAGMKWEYARASTGERKFVIGNADEGEPGTFKDRVLLTELPDRVFAGMTIAGYAIGAKEGILYLRGEYAYLRPYLEAVLAQRRSDGLLGPKVAGKNPFAFDIRIQMGAGAYVCGEESALLESCEGRRGDPRNRPPFPAQKGYLGGPTVVNNVETLCCVTKILEAGPAEFAQHGSTGSTGTKLLSVSGDCRLPGIYEVPFGTPLAEVLRLAQGEDAFAVQVGGPSGQLVSRTEFTRTIDYENLATGGSIMVFGPGRNLLEIVHAFLEFFADESCGYCTPCRAGTAFLLRMVERIAAGRGEPADLARMEELGLTMKAASRCGLGQTAANPVLTSLVNFRPVYDALVMEDPEGFRRSFELDKAVMEAELLSGRRSKHAGIEKGGHR